MTRAEVENAIAAMLGAGIGVTVSGLHGVSKVAARQDMSEILRRFQAAGEDHPQQSQRDEACGQAFHDRQYTDPSGFGRGSALLHDWVHPNRAVNRILAEAPVGAVRTAR